MTKKSKKMVYHGLLHDVHNYGAIIANDSKLGVTRIPLPKNEGEPRGPQKVKQRKNNMQ